MKKRWVLLIVFCLLIQFSACGAENNVLPEVLQNDETAVPSPDGAGRLEYENGAVYEGSLVNGFPEGKGTIIWEEGDQCIAEWCNGEISGWCVYIDTEGYIYTGEWKPELRSAPGQYAWPKGAYEGDIKNGLPDGYGTMTWKDSSVYEGEWKEGKRSGQGTMTWPDGSCYQGEWLENRRHGNGRMEWQAKDLFIGNTIYDGQWKNDMPDGQGNMTWGYIANYGCGNRYCLYNGQWKNGLQEGYGTYVFGERPGLIPYYYEGDWEKGNPNGEGKYISDYTTYEGEWSAGTIEDCYGKKEEYRYTVEKIFRGDDRQEAGKTTYFDGTVKEEYGNGDTLTTWIDGKTRICEGGKEITTWPDGRVGLYENGAYTLTWPDGRCYSGNRSRDSETEGDPFPERMDTNQEIARKEYKDGAIYEGDMKQGKPDGLGTMFYADGSMYEGSWKSGIRSGYGTMTYANGEIYEGQWKKDVPSGYGILTEDAEDPEKTIYAGEWKNGKRHGNGIARGMQVTSYYDDTAIYNGEWKNGVRCGNGKAVLNSGSLVFEGEWKNDLPNGYGVMSYAQYITVEGQWRSGCLKGEAVISHWYGDLYEGSYENMIWCESDSFGQIGGNGSGTVSYLDGRTYQGEVSGGFTPDGYGTMTYTDGSTYTGNWSFYGNFHGKGTFVDPAGESYKGIWEKGSMQQEDGTYVFRDGIFTGTVKDGRPDAGEGKLVCWDGTICQGEWEDAFYGNGIITYPDGGRYEGEWSYYYSITCNDMGTMTQPDGTVLHGNWRNNLLYGTGRAYYPDGSVYEGEFAGNAPNGAGTITGPNGVSYSGEWTGFSSENESPDVFRGYSIADTMFNCR